MWTVFEFATTFISVYKYKYLSGAFAFSLGLIHLLVDYPEDGGISFNHCENR